MTIYVQYDPSSADENQHCFCSIVTIPSRTDENANPAAPIPPLGIAQLVLPDGTDTKSKIVDLSQDPICLI